MHKQQINTCDMTLKKNSAQWLRLLTPEGAVDHKLKSLQGRWPCWVCGWLLAGLQPQCQALPACPHKPRCCHQQREPAACCLSTSLHNTASIGGGSTSEPKQEFIWGCFQAPLCLTDIFRLISRVNQLWVAFSLCLFLNSSYFSGLLSFVLWCSAS